ncbi:amidohydrolase family protein [Amycolatopsis taiwanensis]|uniref:4-hydroxyphenyl-beta-ketoacyl-CoA hydrolase n=1 Tax=Amycolatopsis taiwanensis TaxID=342230 RepID=A0A9W6VL71_9PSEU|nr:amidohydrolase family protein [Amycolatopsis taiwanensis]GLY70221.1 4-hydroxyphenyl-beta-ketoacyl-CoA hydrolase [Amycolatopsis taiwanensis]
MTTTYRPAIDVAAITALDMHTHVHASVHETEPAHNETLAAMAKYFKSGDTPPATLPDLAAYYRERGIAAVTFTVDKGPTKPDPILRNDEIVELAAQHSDIVIPFASVHPARGEQAAREAERLITEGGVRGFKFHPNSMAFFPNDRSAYDLYEVLNAHRVPALFHTGQSGAGAGTRGGGGIRLKYSNPLHLDDVATDFPDMPIVLAHPSFPWQEEALAIAVHKPQVYLELSGWSPKYFPPILVQYANTLLRDRVLFGSDFPLITPDRWLADLEKTGIRDEVKSGLLKNNAVRLLGL